MLNIFFHAMRCLDIVSIISNREKSGKNKLSLVHVWIKPISLEKIYFSQNQL